MNRILRAARSALALSPAVLLLASGSPALAGGVAGPVARVLPPEVEAFTGGTFKVSIEVDMTPSGERLGSYGAVLKWDPAALRYLSDSGGAAPFDTPVVNRSDSALGTLRFADASPAGSAGRVRVLIVELMAVAAPCARASLDLEFTSLYAAGTFVDLLPFLAVGDGAALITDFFFDLRASDPVNTVLRWNAIPGALDYDVIRGSEPNLFDDGVFIRLGPVLCLENNSADTTTAAGTEPANPDRVVPRPGEAFFYLVRFFDGARNSTYGFRGRCSRERIAGAGDCP